MGGCSAQKKKKLRRLMREDPRCWYCDTTVIHPAGTGGWVPDNYAVVQSRVPRSKTHGQPQGSQNHLTCYDCAHDIARWGVLINKVSTNDYWARIREQNGWPAPKTNAERRQEKEPA